VQKPLFAESVPVRQPSKFAIFLLPFFWERQMQMIEILLICWKTLAKYLIFNKKVQSYDKLAN